MQNSAGAGKGDLRIARAGLIQFVGQLIALVTGLVFITLVTRNLSVSDFGAWQLVGNVAGIALLPLDVITFWSVREIARGEKAGKASLMASIIMLPLTLLLFFGIMTGTSTRAEIALVVIIAGLIHLPFVVLYHSLQGIVQGSRPSLLGYAGIPFELVKLGTAYYFVLVLKIGLQGAIIALAVAYLVQDLFLFYGISDIIRGKTDFQKIIQWVKASWVPGLAYVAGRLWSSDVIAVALVLGTVGPVGLFQAARVFTAIISYSDAFRRVLYPKLIRDRIGSDVSIAFRLQSLLRIPMIVGALVLADDMLSVLGFSYVKSAFVLRLLAVIAIVEGTEQLMHTTLMGSETIDAKVGGSSFKSLRRSWLIRLPVLDLLKTSIYLASLSIALYFFSSSSPEIAASTWAIIYGVVMVPFALLKTFLARKTLPHDLPIKEIVKYALAGAVMGIIIYLLKGPVPSATVSVLEALIRLIPLVMLGAVVYFSLVLIMDSYLRRSIRRFIGRGE